MAVQNLNLGAIKDVAVNEIHTVCHVYCTGQGGGGGNVGWLPTGGALVQHPLAVGGTVTFNINNQSGMIANGCASVVQLLWSNDNAVAATNSKSDMAETVLKS
ncbi:MAG: hypothetical protein ACI9Y7_002073 [Dokdonia sp.]|jgi:hypothetical protein